MAAEFYHKTTALFEEFSKRELRYLNADKRMNINLNWKKDFNVPTQDYLQKINKRERETEQTYRELMKHMENLDKQTDQMSLKLEKLHALRSIAMSSINTVWPSVDTPLQSHYNIPLTYNTPIIHSIPSSNVMHSMSVDYTHSKFNSQDESTQTDDVICGQCHFPLAMYPNHIEDASKTMTKTYRNDVSMHEMNEVHQNPLKSGMQPIPQTEINDIKELYTDVEEKFVSENFLQDLSVSEDISSRNDNPAAEVPALKCAVNTEVRKSFEVHWSDDPQIDAREKESVDENTLESTGTIENVVSKSDDESMNHEFDFLESDKRSSIKGDDTRLIDPNSSNKNNIVTENLKLESGHDPNFQENANSKKVNSVPADVTDLKQTKHVSELPYLLNTEDIDRIEVSGDYKLDSSISGGHPTPPFHSENASLASESDSFSEKDTPLTASAAYQALLGNVSASKTVQKSRPISDSDSEDEIENALATAVRKSSNVNFEASGPSLKAEGRKESVSEAKLKSETKTSLSSNKPQTKLSKSTRKVLGLDTSSGSEVEFAVKTNLNKNAEDSDEFDFYD